MRTPIRSFRRPAVPGPGSIFLSLGLLCTVSLFSLPARGASNVQIQVDGRTITLPEAGNKVRDALAVARVKLNRNDQVTPALDEPTPSDGVIHVTRIVLEEQVQEIKLPHRTIIRPATRENHPYHPTVTTAGRDGLKRLTYQVRIVDGHEEERTLISDVTVREPVHQIVTSRQAQVLASRGAYTGQRTMRVMATAYDPGPGSCGKFADNKTCNGKRAGYGIIAVDPKVIPLGAKLFVEGYGYGIASDVGSAIQGSHIDLGFNSRSGSLQWGKKWVTIRILD